MNEIQITVTDRRTQNSVAHAHVGVFVVEDNKHVDGDPNAVLLHGICDDFGRCSLQTELSACELTTVGFAVRARGYAEYREMNFARESTRRVLEPLTRIDVALERGVTLEGIVTDRAGNPVPRAHIHLVLSMPYGCSWPHAIGVTRSLNWPPPCWTDERGRFEWLSFPIERARDDAHFVLTAEHPAFAPALVYSVEALPRDESDVIQIPVILERGESLEGTVLLPDGSPARGAEVAVRALPTPEQPVCVVFQKSAETDVAGRWTAHGLKRSTNRVDIEHAGCAPFTRELDIADATAPLEVQLELGCDLEGQALHRDGKPIVGARVSASMRNLRTWRETWTDDAGRFRLIGLPATGPLQIRCESITADVSLPSEPLVLRALARVDFRAQLVADESSEPVGPPAYLSVLGPGFSTVFRADEHGMIHQPQMPAAKYEVYADAPGRAIVGSTIELTENTSDTPLIIRIPKGGAVRGKVTAEDGIPIAHVNIVAYGSYSGHERRTQSNGAGEYHIEGLGRNATLVFTIENLAFRSCPLKSTGTCESPVLLDVIMHEGATLTGTVVRGDGTPIPRTRVKLEFPGVRMVPFDLPSALTDENGGFELRHVPERTFAVMSGTAKVEVNAKRGENAAIELRVQ